MPGRPMLYSTTRRFLEVFGLGTLKELPSLRELDELAREQGVVLPGMEPPDEAAAELDPAASEAVIGEAVDSENESTSS